MTLTQKFIQIQTLLKLNSQNMTILEQEEAYTNRLEAFSFEIFRVHAK